MIANTPKTPYYAVIFTSINTAEGIDYSEMADEMVQFALQQDGFIGMESARNELGVTVFYWRDLKSIKLWKENTEHTLARKRDRKEW